MAKAKTTKAKVKKDKRLSNPTIDKEKKKAKLERVAIKHQKNVEKYGENYMEIKKQRKLLAKEKKGKKRKKEEIENEATETEEKVEEKEAPKESSKNAENVSSFSQLRLKPQTLERLNSLGYTKAFPIQAQTFDPIFDGKDLIGRAITGSGKTLAFALPIVEKLPVRNLTFGRKPIVLCLAPTRELASQTFLLFGKLAKSSKDESKKIQGLCVYGGVAYDNQLETIRKGFDILVGTPGRIIDLVDTGSLDLSEIKYMILDEADEMLNIGFGPSIEYIIEQTRKSGNKPQMILFSATIPQWVNEISSKYLEPGFVLVDTVSGSLNKTPQQVRHLALKVDVSMRERLPSIINSLMSVYGQSACTMIFTDTKTEANSISSTIDINCGVLHGDLSQALRESTLQSFRKGQFPCLVATNVAARGLDIPSVDLIIQTQPPTTTETYIHRSGRTGRAGRSGTVITLFSQNRQYRLKTISKEAGVSIQYIDLPTPISLLKNAMDSVFREMGEVHPDNLKFFQQIAKDYFKQKQNEDSEHKTKKTKREEIIKSFATLLAVSTNNKKKINWTPSLLSLKTNMVALKVILQPELGEKIESSVDFKRALVDHLSKLCQSASGNNPAIPIAVKVPNEKFTYIIDVPENFVDKVFGVSQKDVSVEYLLQLPEGIKRITSNPPIRNQRTNEAYNNRFQRNNFGRQANNNRFQRNNFGRQAEKSFAYRK